MSAALPSPVPPAALHERIRADLEHLILSGQWPPGHRVPSEHELMARYRCARMTVSKVLTQIAAAGLIDRRRKLGSFVRQAMSSSAVLELPDIAQEVQRTGQAYGFRMLERARRRSLRVDRERLGVDAAVPVLRLACVHFAGTQTFAHEERLINLQVVPAAALETFEQTPPGGWLLRHVPWISAEHRIRAVAADDALAEALDVAIGHACLATERRTWSADGQPVTWALLTSPAASRELVARFSPSQGTRHAAPGVGR